MYGTLEIDFNCLLTIDVVFKFQEGLEREGPTQVIYHIHCYQLV